MNESSGWRIKCKDYLRITLCSSVLLFTVVYFYLYSNISMRTIAIGKAMTGTIQDFQLWRVKMGDWVDMLYPVPQNLSTTSRNDTRPIATNQHPSSEPEVLLTLFTTWPTRAEKYVCHNNTLSNWIQLKPSVRLILFTNEEKLVTEATGKGWHALPVPGNGSGIPVLKFMYMDAKKIVKSHFYAYANGDILFTDELLQTLAAVLNSTALPRHTPIMIIGRRTNVKDVTPPEAGSFQNVSETAYIRGKLYNTWAEDYFITSADYPWKNIPEVVIGRRAYDNWLVMNARKQQHVTIDATETLLALHQTTNAGNSEGHKARDPEYNHRLLTRLYKHLNYGAGLTSCAQYHTRYDDVTQPKIVRRIRTCL